MAALRIKRQAVTHRGVGRRIEDAALERITDPRQQAKTRFPLHGVLGLTAAAMASGALALRHIERRSEQMRPALRQQLGLPCERIADNTLSTLLPRLDPEELRQALHRQNKAEARRGNLTPTRLDCGLSCVAIDGKVLSTLRLHDLTLLTHAVLKEQGDPRTRREGWQPGPRQIRAVFRKHFPHVQLVHNKNAPMHGLVRLHRSTLISAEAAVCLDQRPIAGATNEVGAIGKAVSELVAAYRRTKLVELVTMDAGNTCRKVAEDLVSQGVAYFLTIKSVQGSIFEEAVRVLADEACPVAVASASEERSGNMVAYQVFMHDLSEAGWLEWEHARQVVRVERVVSDDEGQVSCESRYFVCSLSPEELGAEDALALCRMHWRCENEGHWTSDVLFEEDARRAVGSRHPVGMVVMSLLRMMAQNILAVLRVLSRTLSEKSPRPSWRAAMEHALVSLFMPVLESQRFDAVEV